MLQNKDIKCSLKDVGNGQVEFKLAKSGVPDAVGTSYPASSNTEGGAVDFVHGKHAEATVKIAEINGMGEYRRVAQKRFVRHV